MPLVRFPEPLDHPDGVFEVKHDGFRAVAVVEGHRFRSCPAAGAPSQIGRERHRLAISAKFLRASYRVAVLKIRRL